MNIDYLRHNYSDRGLSKKELSDNPFEQFDIWFNEAIAARIEEPNSMNLATVSKDGQPSVRAVLLKSYDEHGFVFYTNYESRKAKNIEDNPKVALQFLWITLGRQLRIEGKAEKISTKESKEYFKTRSRESQLGAWASAQSRIINSREDLEKELERVEQNFKDQEVILPSFWGGYRVKPISFEFWQGRSDRLSDRVLYTQREKIWIKNRLAP